MPQKAKADCALPRPKAHRHLRLRLHLLLCLQETIVVSTLVTGVLGPITGIVSANVAAIDGIAIMAAVALAAPGTASVLDRALMTMQTVVVA